MFGCYGLYSRTSIPGGALKVLLVFSIVKRMDNRCIAKAAVCLEECVGECDDAERVYEMHIWSKCVPGLAAFGKRRSSSSTTTDFGRHLTMLPSRGLRPAQFTCSNSRQSTLLRSSASRKVRKARPAASSCALFHARTPLRIPQLPVSCSYATHDTPLCKALTCRNSDR